MRVAATMISGDTFATKTQLWMCTADRLGFERHFGYSLARARSLYRDDGTPREDADLGQMREEWIVFFAWRCLVRDCEGVSPFAEFCEAIADVEIVPEDMAEGEAANPTPAPPPGSSP